MRRHQLRAPRRRLPKGAAFSDWRYQLTVLNINAWTTFKDKLDDVHFHQTLGNSTAMLIQEHKILTGGSR